MLKQPKWTTFAGVSSVLQHIGNASSLNVRNHLGRIHLNVLPSIRRLGAAHLSRDALGVGIGLAKFDVYNSNYRE